VHRDVRFTKAMTADAGAGIAARVGWPGLRVQRSGPAWASGPAPQLPASRARTVNPASRVDAGEAGDERWPRPTGVPDEVHPQRSARPDRRCRRGAAGAGAPGSGQHHERPVHRHAQAPFFDHLDSSGRPVEIQDQRWDDDIRDLIPSADDPHGITTCTITFNSTTAQDKSAARALPDSDARGDDNE
jgi:hypothetical protein